MHIGNLFLRHSQKKYFVSKPYHVFESFLCSIDCEIVQHVAGDKAKLFFLYFWVVRNYDSLRTFHACVPSHRFHINILYAQTRSLETASTLINFHSMYVRLQRQ